MQMWELVARESVRATSSAYTVAGDRFQLDALAACFAQDGTLEVKDRMQATGRAEIVTMLRESSARQRPPTERFYVRHFVSAPAFLSVTPDRVETLAYFQVLTPSGLDHWGRYRDVLVPVEDSWLFQHRQVTPDGWVEGGWFAAGEPA